MKARCALHVHSRLSHDGTMTIAELASFYRRHGFHYVAIGEHSQDIDVDRVDALVRECAEQSGAEFCMVPGVEFTCGNGMHILGVGCTVLTAERDASRVAGHIRANDGFAILAHPSRYKWRCDEEIVRAVEAVEVWNVGYDGKYAPAPPARAQFRSMQRVNPEITAVACHDLHKLAGFYDVRLEIDVDVLDRANLLRQLRARAFYCRSWLVNFGPQLSTGSFGALYFDCISRTAHLLRRIRNGVGR